MMGVACGVSAGSLADVIHVADGVAATAVAVAVGLQCCALALVPPFLADDPVRAALDYRLRRAVWLYTLPLGATGLALAVALAGWATGSARLEQGILLLSVTAPCVGVAWAVAEVGDRLPARMPNRAIGVPVTIVTAIVVAVSAGIVLLIGLPHLLTWSRLGPTLSPLDVATGWVMPAHVVHALFPIGIEALTLGLLLPTCEDCWHVPPPRTARPWPWPLLVAVLLAATYVGTSLCGLWK
jgi:hypothetical protein